MKKTMIISFGTLLKKLITFTLIAGVTTASFSLGIPQYICGEIANELLMSQSEPKASVSSQIRRIFSLTSGNTVYAAMPMESHEKVLTNPAPTATKTEVIPSQSEPIPPETNLSNNPIHQTVEIKNHTKKQFDTTKLLESPLSYQPAGNAYKVLLVHTHTTECYFPNDRSDNPNENMIQIGKEFKKILEQNGIPTLHIETVHDVPYTTSYKKSLESVTKALKEHPSIEVVIDLHRDAIYGSNGEKLRPVTTINGEDCAQVMLVCGTDEGGLPHPDWSRNLSFGLKIQSRMQNDYPGLARPLDLRRERFNTHTTKNSVIFEIGSNGNSKEEAINGAKLAAQAVSDVLTNK